MVKLGLFLFVRALAPGVYFGREGPQAAGGKPQSVRKVVITR